MSGTCYSYSRLSAWEQCPYSYYLSYVKHTCECGYVGSTEDFKHGDAYECPVCHHVYSEAEFRGLKDEQTNNAFAEYGSFCHEIFEKYANGEYALEDLPDIYDFGFDAAFTVDFPKLGKTDMKDSYYRKGLEFYKNWAGFGNVQLLGAEEHFVMDIGDGDSMQGFIDLQYFDENGLLVCQDYKSKSSFKKGELEKYARQLYIYGAYMSNKYDKFPDVLRFFLFRENKYVDVPFNTLDYLKAWSWVNDTIHDIESAWQYEEKPDRFYCMNLCDHRMNCKYGSFDAWRKE